MKLKSVFLLGLIVLSSSTPTGSVTFELSQSNRNALQASVGIYHEQPFPKSFEDEILDHINTIRIKYNLTGIPFLVEGVTFEEKDEMQAFISQGKLPIRLLTMQVDRDKNPDTTQTDPPYDNIFKFFSLDVIKKNIFSRKSRGRVDMRRGSSAIFGHPSNMQPDHCIGGIIRIDESWFKKLSDQEQDFIISYACNVIKELIANTSKLKDSWWEANNKNKEFISAVIDQMTLYENEYNVRSVISNRAFKKQYNLMIERLKNETGTALEVLKKRLSIYRS